MHTAQVNFFLVSDSFLFSASNDKTIIKWSLEERSPSITFERLSATALGHLGTVYSLAMYRNTLFSASSDLTTR
jgi:WD40 repeat protein